MQQKYQAFFTASETYNDDVAAMVKQANDIEERRKALIADGKKLGIKMAEMNASLKKVKVTAKVASADEGEPNGDGDGD